MLPTSTVAILAGFVGFIGGSVFIVVVLTLLGRRRRREIGGYHERKYNSGSHSCYYGDRKKKAEEMEWDDGGLSIIVNPMDVCKNVKDENSTPESMNRLEQVLIDGESEEEEDDDKRVKKKDSLKRRGVELEWDDGMLMV